MKKGSVYISRQLLQDRDRFNLPQNTRNKVKNNVICYLQCRVEVYLTSDSKSDYNWTESEM